MHWKNIALVSVAVNLALGAWLFTRRTAMPPPALLADMRSSPANAGPASGLPPVAATASGSQGAAVTPFHWSQVESTDYLAYVANLRRIGCPEATIRDIIVADVNNLYAPRFAALRSTSPELAWWGRFDKRKAVRAALVEQLRVLNEEKKALLVRLLGSSAGLESSAVETSVVTARAAAMLDFVAASRQPAVRDILGRYEALAEWGREQWKLLSSDERDAKEKELREARARELAAVLSPDELREFEFRHSPVADELREQFGRADLTEAEFRRMHELRRDFEAKNPNAGIDDWKRFDSELGSALGSDRFADIQRQNDSAWRGMQSLAANHNLSPDAMQQAYGVHKDYREKLIQAVRQMFADPQQNPQPLRDLAAERDRQLAGILGPGAVQDLNRLDALPRLVIQDDGRRKSYSFSQGGFGE